MGKVGSGSWAPSVSKVEYSKLETIAKTMGLNFYSRMSGWVGAWGPQLKLLLCHVWPTGCQLDSHGINRDGLGLYSARWQFIQEKAKGLSTDLVGTADNQLI